LLAIILASAVTYVDESVVNVALPAIAKDQVTSVAAIQWVANAYMLCLAAFILVGGAVGDRLGRRKVFLAGITIFAFASVWSGISPNLPQLLTARILQGIGAALLIPCSLAIIGASFPEAERNKAIGTWAGFSAIATGVGPLLGGWLVDHVSWRAIFFISPFLAVFAGWIAWRQLPESHDPEATVEIDWLGSLLAFGGLGGIALGLIALPNRGMREISTITCLAIGVLLLIGFVWHEKRTRFPMLPLGLFRSRAFTGINVLTLLLYGSLGGAFFLLPFELIQVHGYSASVAGVAFLPFTVIMATLARWLGGLFGRVGPRLPLVVAPMIAATGFTVFALAGSTTPFVVGFLLPISVVGLGMAVHVVPLTSTVINSVPEHHTGVASGINNAAASLANLLAIVIFGAVALNGFNSSLDRHLQLPTLSSVVKQTIERAHGNFVMESSLTSEMDEDRAIAEAIIKDSLAKGIRIAMLLAAAVALAGTLCATLTIRTSKVPQLPGGK
jgi:EmrB/QacA subfamily drug resistance transporter